MKIRCGFSSVRGCVAGGLALLLIVGASIQPALTSASDRKHFARISKTQQQSQSGKAKKVPPLPPERGAPLPNLPNLDEIRQRQRSEPQAPAPIESTKRSRRKSGKSAQDKKSHHVSRSRTALTRNLRYRIATEPAPPQSGQPLFTDDPLKNPNNPDSFKIKAVHITELRAAINTVRNHRHLPDYSWVKPTASTGAINSNVLISWEPINEMQTALNQAIGPPATPYTGGLAQGQPILAVHIQELRERVKDILGVTSIADQLVPSRIDPLNESGNQIEARDCEWGLPLVSLPGRAGLDLGIGLSYSSMVWTQAGSSISFDDDWGDPSPGFKIGFPTVQGRYTDNQVGTNVYLLITSAGRRVELRRVGASNIYEAGDSSYLQLIDNGSSLLVRTTDGTQMSYGKFGSDWHCTAIEDRNGNLILANYNSFGDIDHITDTLGRTFTFHYDGNYNLQSITQTWTVNGVATTHTWATFGWGAVTMHPAFSNVTVVGTFDGEVMPVLTQVGLADGSHYNFEYTDRGQVNVIRHYAADGGPGTGDDFQLSYLAYNYESPSADCPRISAARVWAQNWSDVAGVPHQVISYFADNHDGSHQMTAPDGTVYKEVYGDSGDSPAWKHGLVTSSQVKTGSTTQKTTTTSWTQDNESVNYQTNPRVSQTVVSDGTNTRKTTIDYSNAAYAQYGLPYFVSEYAADGLTEIRRSYNDYNLSQAYLDRRIIGLISARHVYNPSTGEWLSKSTYGYDGSGLNSQGTTAPGHDQTYDASFTLRGNVTSVSRWDVTDIGNAAKALSSQMSYDAAGNALSTTDPNSHTNSIGYSDSFAGTYSGANTFAYPTTLTDADGFSSYVQYNYDFAARTRTQGPPPGNPGQYANGIIQTFGYDEASRLKQVTIVNTGAYVHYDYGPDYTSSFASVNSVAANYWESDSYTNRFFDGLGRVFAMASNHPGSTGGNKAQYTRYDQMGRAVQQTNPFEMDSGWNPAGDDAAGYQFNVANTFDWKGRTLRTYNMDGTYKEASYAGCGCAGGEVATLADEVGRQERVYSDSLGRQWKTEVLNSDTSVYSTSETTLNGRDQATLVRQFQGDDQSGVHQDTTMNYDGYGRLQTKHAPEQNVGTATTYEYNTDDTIQSVTDARGASATYGYSNNRGLVTSISYSAPFGVATTAAVGFGYDAAGNRTSMSDGLGLVSYNYDSLSRLTSESRTFSGVGTYALSYQYNLANELTSIVDPFGATLNYGFDSTGRLNSVSGSGYSAVNQFASNMQYRAWGGLKAATYDSTRSLAISYDSRMNPTSFRIVGQNYTAGSEYQYYADRQISYSHDLTDDRFDRSYSYDQLARLTSSFTGSEARGGNVADGPYRQTYGYDTWGNLNQRTGRDWSHNSAPVSFTYDSSTNRNSQWQYDAEGNVVGQGTRHYSYDAIGQQVSTSQTGGSSASQTFDGDGFEVRNSYPGWVGYTLRSSALNGAVVAELNGQGQPWRSFIYANGQVLAEQDDVYPQVVWKHRSPSNNSEFVSLTGSTGASRFHEYDPMGTEFGDDDPYLNGGSYDDWTHGQGVPSDLTTGCSWEGMAIGCEFAIKFTGWLGINGRVKVTSDIPGVSTTRNQTSLVRSSAVPLGEKPKFSAGDIINYKNLITTPDSYQTSIVPTRQYRVTVRAGGTSSDPCAYLLPANIPDGVDVDKNMKTAEDIYRDSTRRDPDLGGTAGYGMQPIVAFRDFYNRVKGGGEWDYKLRDPEGIRINGISKYDEFGNFNFGATGAAERIPEGALLRAAGRAQQDDADPKVRAAGKGVAVQSWMDIFSNNGEAPFGDKPEDQEAIKRGIAYFDCRRTHPR